MSSTPSTPSQSPSTQRVRNQIDHPVIDSDGHMLEFLAPVRDRLRELAGEELAQGFDAILGGQQAAMRMSAEDRRNIGMFRLTWWGFPARNTLDRATAMLPKLQYERLPEQGIDFAIVYPTFGLTAPMVDTQELRTALVPPYLGACAKLRCPHPRGHATADTCRSTLLVIDRSSTSIL
jgi:hypothetical protein